MSDRDKKGQFVKGHKTGNRFTSENQPDNPGRRPSLLRRLERITKKEFNVELSKSDYEDLYAWALERTPDELKELQGEGSNDIPMIVLVLVKSLLGDVKNGNMNNLKLIMEQINKTATKIDVTSGGKELKDRPLAFISASELTKEQLNEYLIQDKKDNETEI